MDIVNNLTKLYLVTLVDARRACERAWDHHAAMRQAADRHGVSAVDAELIQDGSLVPWITGMGCDLCGFGTVENVDEFDPAKPCPECETVALPLNAAECGAVKGIGAVQP